MPGRNVKIAFLTNDLGGGTGNHLLSMMKHWDKSRWQAEIISSAPVRDRVVPDVPVEYIPPTKKLGIYPLAQILYLAHLRKIMKAQRPDILHTFFFWSIIYGRLLKLAGTVKTLVENREDQGFNWGTHEYLWLRRTRHLPDRIICVASAVKKVVMEREGVDESRLTVVNNGVDPDHHSSGMQAITRRELGFSNDHLVVGMVANYNRPVKGVTYFLDAIPAIISAVPSARFLIVGGGDEANSLLSKAQRLGIQPYLVFAGFKKDIHRYYEIMDISVLTSLSEGLSMTLMESMSYCIPVVATRVGGNPEVVDEGQTGYLVPVQDPGTLADRIIKLLQDKELRQGMGREARRCIERRFQLRDVANRYLEIYMDLTNDRLRDASSSLTAC